MHFCRWRIVFHGAIDGYSRLIVFLDASDNNRKSTVADNFLRATQVYGVPSRIRVDHGGENTTICEIMESVRGGNRGSAIRGMSVHNQRIERSWLDLWNGVSNLYYDVFNFLESRGSLDVEKQSHLWALHYTFMPRIRRDLKRYVIQWNNHGLRTQNHKTPLQLFVKRSLNLSLRNILTASDALRQFPDISQEQWAQQPAAQGSAIECPLNDEQLLEVQQLIDPMSDLVDNLGMSIYLQVLQYVTDHQDV